MFSLMIICRIQLSVNLIQKGLSPEAEKTGRGRVMWTMTQLLCRRGPQSLCDPTWSGLLAEDGIGCPVGMVRVSVWVSEKVLGPNSLDFRSYYSHVQGPAATAQSGSLLEMQGLRPPRPTGLKPVSHQARQGAQAPSTSGSSAPGHWFPRRLSITVICGAG